MDKRLRIMISFVFLVGIISGFYFFSDWVSKTLGYALTSGEVLEVVDCLEGHNAVLYVGNNCEACEEQGKIFGNGLKFIDVKDCGENNCVGLRELPAWEIDGQFYYGLQSLNEIKEIVKCEP